MREVVSVGCMLSVNVIPLVSLLSMKLLLGNINYGEFNQVISMLGDMYTSSVETLEQ